MRNNPSWHGRAPNREELAQALKEIDLKNKQVSLKQKLVKKGVLR